MTKFCNSQRKCFLIIKVMRIRIIPLDDDKTRINTKINSSLEFKGVRKRISFHGYDTYCFSNNFSSPSFHPLTFYLHHGNRGNACSNGVARTMDALSLCQLSNLSTTSPLFRPLIPLFQHLKTSLLSRLNTISNDDLSESTICEPRM